MRTHTTSTLKDLIKVKMQSEIPMSIQETETWINVLPEITKELLELIHFFTRSIFGLSLIKRQLQQMQKESTHLLNLITQYVPEGAKMLLLKNEIMKCLDTTLNTIVNDNWEYADLSNNMSQFHYKIKMDVIKSHLTETKELLQKKEIKPALKSVVLESFQKLIGYKSASYETVQYVTNLQSNINTVLSTNSNQNIEYFLIHHLYENHYNSTLFCQFLITKYKLEVDEIKDLHDKQRHLRQTLGDLNKPRVTPRKPKYIRNERSIYDSLKRSIETQISCLAIAIDKAKPKLISVKAPVPIPYCPADYKLRFNFSVESLAYLIKLLVNANIIEPGIKAELLRYVAANFQTPGTKMGGIAAGSFQTKYKNVTQSTSVTVRAALMAMLKLLDKEF